MAKYGDVFPDSAAGHAHIDASLPLAEHLHPDAVLAAAPDLGRNASDSRVLDYAMNLVEHALATPECGEPDAADLDRAEILARVITSTSRSPITDPSVVGAHLLDIQMEGFRARANREPITAQMIARVATATGSLLVRYHDAFRPSTDRERTERYFGTMSEIIVPYAYAVGGEFAFTTSRRQERNVFAGDNYDSYLLRDIGADHPLCVPLSVKHVGPPGPDPRLVLMLRVGLIARQAIIRGHQFMGDTSNVETVTTTRLMADIMGRHAKGEQLSQAEQDSLDDFVGRLINDANAYERRNRRKRLADRDLD